MPIPELREGHRRFKDRFAAMREFYERQAAEGQHPKALWIGCSDSRVIPEIITAADPGDLFIMRNIANIVPPFGSPGAEQSGAVIEYATSTLTVSNIVVCGHTGCGGIKALCGPVDPEQSPNLARWIEHARAACTRVEAARVPESEREIEVAKANVLLQRGNVLTYPGVRARVEAGDLTVHACLYELLTGDLLVAGEDEGEWRAFPVT